MRTFKVRGPRWQGIHDQGRDPSRCRATAEVNEYVAGAEKIVQRGRAPSSASIRSSTRHYTFLGDYVPWGGGDGMEHRNSTVVAAPISLQHPGMVGDVLDTVSHEFFHAWNVERIRPKSLEPFNFEEANISGELWLAEGFTQYYGTLDHGARRPVDARRDRVPDSPARAVSVINSPGRQFQIGRAR